MKLSATMSNYERALSEQRQTSSCHPAQTIKEAEVDRIRSAAKNDRMEWSWVNG